MAFLSFSSDDREVLYHLLGDLSARYVQASSRLDAEAHRQLRCINDCDICGAHDICLELLHDLENDAIFAEQRMTALSNALSVINAAVSVLDYGAHYDCPSSSSQE